MFGNIFLTLGFYVSHCKVEYNNVEFMMDNAFIAKYSAKIALNSVRAPNNTCLLWTGFLKSQKIKYGAINCFYKKSGHCF